VTIPYNFEKFYMIRKLHRTLVWVVSKTRNATFLFVMSIGWVYCTCWAVLWVRPFQRFILSCRIDTSMNKCIYIYVCSLRDTLRLQYQSISKFSRIYLIHLLFQRVILYSFNLVLFVYLPTFWTFFCIFS